ncbi:DUF2860 family protein [Marinobacter zhejiangensis]|uniref:DUF2860 domain-containing protein n=1 Tax=Marinobacter zhejiangensis TaxID=488535 RepID=A0A1I4P1Z5_9GAMM|nr:DUF2860 family protein [Marinobacter zhejiangensis]SFM21792.1 Protein of unknown function [Marinobacter zhejiangensis]
MKRLSLVALALAGATGAQAEIIKIPEQSGFSGHVMAGAQYLGYESNFYKGPDTDNNLHNGLTNSPDNNTMARPILGGDVRYTFAETRTQVFLGNMIQDAVRFDYAQQLGVRQQIGDRGIVGIGYVFSLQDAETWEDPYQVGNRTESDVESDGARFSWDQIWGTRFNASYTYRDIDLDNEQSGLSQGLSADEMTLLDRNGQSHRYNVSYDWVVAPGHVLRPELVYTRADLDGKAVSYDRTRFQVTYGYNSERWSLATNAFYGQTQYDEVNPIFGTDADSDQFGIGSSFFWHNLFGVNHLSGMVLAHYIQSSADSIAFYDAYAGSLSLGVMYRF